MTEPMTTLVGWYACEQPEREPDPYVRWHYNPCRGCLVKIEAQERRFPEDRHVRLLADLLRVGRAAS